MKSHSDIHITVSRDDEGIEGIQWEATDSGEPQQDAHAMLLALWDPKARQALRIDLWTKEMTVEDMNAFVYQTLHTLADTYRNATNNLELMADMKTFAQEFGEKAAKMARR